MDENEEKKGDGWVIPAVVLAGLGIAGVAIYLFTKNAGATPGDDGPPTPSTTHRVCQSGKCTTVTGAGANECTYDYDCTPGGGVTGQHKDCVGGACIYVNNAPGVASQPDTCATNVNCTPRDPVPTTITVTPLVVADSMRDGGWCCPPGTPLPYWEGTFTLTVTDQNGAPMPNATVIIHQDNAVWVAKQPMDMAGNVIGPSKTLNCNDIAVFTDTNGRGKFKVIAIRDAGYNTAAQTNMECRVVSYASRTGIPIPTNPQPAITVSISLVGRWGAGPFSATCASACHNKYDTRISCDD